MFDFSASYNCDGSLSIEESGAIIAVRGDMAVAVTLSTVEMRQFASMLNRAANFFDHGRRIAAADAIGGGQ